MEMAIHKYTVKFITVRQAADQRWKVMDLTSNDSPFSQSKLRFLLKNLKYSQII